MKLNLSEKTLHTIWLGAIALCLVLSLFCLFFSACSAPAEKVVEENDDGNSGGFTVTTAPRESAQNGGMSFTVEDPGATAASGEGGTPEQTASSVRLGLTEDAGRSYLDRIIFLGDSTTYGIGYYYDQGYSELCPPSQVWTPASGTLTLSYYATATIVYPPTGEELSISEAVARAKPDILLITLGVNGVSFMDEEWFIRDYSALVADVRSASPETRIILNSIYPVMSNYMYIDQISNEKIRAANEWIEGVAADTGCKYLYSYEAVVGADGALPAENCNGDGIHLNGEAFTKVMQYIRTHAYQ
ncbi:MAG: SGNH/GDSL hydrolase family protein [Oscillospiraceae bacterium]|nr:SGNH/GDSL hydrolase family protein [Oscillospiraceae bacterium]